MRWWLRCRLSNRKVCFICCRWCCSVCRYYCCCSSLCYVETVRGFTTENLDVLNINSYYTVRCYMTYEYAFEYILHVLLLLLLCTVWLYCCCSSSCCSITCAGWQTFLPWFTASDSIVFFLFVWTRYILKVPLSSTVTQLQLRFVTYCPTHIISYILGNCEQARSQGGRSPPRTFYYFFQDHLLK